jgi:hypothetical protein
MSVDALSTGEQVREYRRMCGGGGRDAVAMLSLRRTACALTQSAHHSSRGLQSGTGDHSALVLAVTILMHMRKYTTVAVYFKVY